MQQRKLIVSAAPFLRHTTTTRGLMGDVVIALLPTALAAVWFFGAPALSLMAVAVFFAVFSEWVYERLSHQKSTIGDLSAVVTGLLLAFNLPANAPWWIAAIGSVLA
ncbi:MAG: RnfABCDGE type electron transport complex subunit D, partial [Clostridia bacterium]